MGADLYATDFFTWTRVQAEALRRLAEERDNTGTDLDLEHLIEEVADLGNEQVLRVQSLLQRFLQHLLQVANAPQTRTIHHWRSEALALRGHAVRRYLPSLRRLVEARLDREWRGAVKLAAAKLDRELPHLPHACPLTLTELLDEDAELAPLLARLAPPKE